MPAKNVVRQYQSGLFYHIYNRGVAKPMIFLEGITEVCQRYSFLLLRSSVLWIPVIAPAKPILPATAVLKEPAPDHQKKHTKSYARSGPMKLLTNKLTYKI